MDNIIKEECKVCSDGNTFQVGKEFNKHLKSHKLTPTEYYQKFYPKTDYYDGSIIKFKNKEYYFNTHFNSKLNLKKWLESVAPTTSQLYVKEILLKRKNAGKLTYAPTQVELKTLMVPGRKWITEQFKDYNNFCNELGLLMRFKDIYLNKDLFKDISNKVIFTDSREQRPLSFENTTRSDGLKFGDYRMSGSSIYIERKSIADGWNTLSSGFERFEREIIRAKEANAYLVILVEGSLNDLERFPYLPHVKNKIKMPIECIYHNIRILLQKYLHIQFLFVKNREEASRIIQLIYSAGEQVKNVDLQYLEDLKEL